MIVFPDYQNTPLHVMSSIAQHFQICTGYPSHQKLDHIFETDYQNVILIVFDGLGVSLLQKHLTPTAFLRNQMADELSAVYPCTTTAAMTSYYTGLSPAAHGWLGWSLFFKEYCRFVDGFTNRDSITGIPLQEPNPAYQLMPYETIYQKIDRTSNGNTKVYTILPEEIPFISQPNVHIGVSSVSEICSHITTLAAQKAKKFIFSYWAEPDDTIHNTGTESSETSQMIRQINQQLEQLCMVLKSRKDTLILISADHGLTDIDETFYLDEYPELMECLILPPLLDCRCASFFVKPDHRSKFEAQFKALFGCDFILLSREQVLQQQLFGQGTPHSKTLDFLGDYLACGVGKKLLFYRSPIHGKIRNFRAHHTGLTWEEMAIPLIVSGI